ncbi:MAG: molybdenum ABC transporter ATP-binding protein [Sphingomonas sp.]|nr:molybdenum ABC transporter ATP-binding protein [Sphingomonas sp.]
MAFDIDIAGRVGDVDVAVQIAGGAGLTILSGPSGVGKTSVLNMVAGLLRPARGRICVSGDILFDAAAGVEVPVARRRAGYVFQDARLFPHMTVRANLGYGAARRTLEMDAIGFLGIHHLLDRWPRSLSGGEARRVAIGRALLSKPRFLLLDEPLSSLDRAHRDAIMRAIEHIRDVLALPILMVTHDAAEIERLATQTIVMTR